MDKFISLPEDIKLFGQETSTEHIFDLIQLDNMIFNSLEGFNCTFLNSLFILCLVTVLCYGHTTAGKTFTMFGNKDKNPGVIPMTLEAIFSYIYEKPLSEFLVRVSYLEIYNEQLNDLLSPTSFKKGDSDYDKFTEEICINMD